MGASRRNSGVAQTVANAPWRNVLSTETVRLDQTAIASGIVTIQLLDKDDADAARNRAIRLLNVALSPTDRYGELSATRIAVLRSPVESISAFADWVRRISDLLIAGNIDVAVGFAPRRPGEHLLKTLARADAELDRSIFRSEHPGGQLTVG